MYCVVPRVIRRDEEAQCVEGVLRDMHHSPNSFHMKVSREIVLIKYKRTFYMLRRWKNIALLQKHTLYTKGRKSCTQHDVATP